MAGIYLYEPVSQAEADAQEYWPGHRHLTGEVLEARATREANAYEVWYAKETETSITQEQWHEYRNSWLETYQRMEQSQG